MNNSAISTDLDLAERMAAVEADLDRAEATFDVVMRNAPAGMALLDLNGRLLAVNPALCQLLDRNEATLLEMTSLDATHPDDVEADIAYGQRVIAGEPVDGPLIKRYIRPNGSVVWGQLTVATLAGPGGEPQRLVGQVIDITAQKEAELEIEHNQALQRMAGQIARIGGWALDLTDGSVRWSTELKRLFGLADDRHVVRSDILERYRPEDRDRIIAAIEACRDHGTPFDIEAELTTFAGQPMVIRLVGERDLAGRRVVGALQDITASKFTAAVTQRLTDQLATTLEAVTDAVFTVDRSWRFTYLNRRAEALFGSPRQAMIGNDIWEAFPSIVGSEVEDAYRQAVTTDEPTHVEAYFCGPLGTWVEEHIFPSDDGLTVFMSDIGAQVVRDQAQQRVITAEREAAERLRELDRMKNAFLSAVSHELRTPLSIVQGAASTLQRLRGELESSTRSEVEDALVEHAGRLGKLLDDLLDMDRLTRTELSSSREQVDIAAVCRRTVATLPDAERVTIDAPPRLYSLGSEVQTERIIANLVGNALKYAPEGEVLVRLRKFAGDRVLLEVHDHGPGIPANELARVFEPFHRIDEHHPQPGTGIGLTLVAEFARMQGGNAWAEAGGPGEPGAHFFVDLPAPPRGRKMAFARVRRSATARS